MDNLARTEESYLETDSEDLFEGLKTGKKGRKLESENGTSGKHTGNVTPRKNGDQYFGGL